MIRKKVTGGETTGGIWSSRGGEIGRGKSLKHPWFENIIMTTNTLYANFKNKKYTKILSMS